MKKQSRNNVPSTPLLTVIKKGKESNALLKVISSGYRFPLMVSPTKMADDPRYWDAGWFANYE
jgi:hypothetical protein